MSVSLFLVLAGVTMGLLWPVRWVLGHLGIVDRPNARSSHQTVTVRGGGVVVISVIAVAMFVRLGRDGLGWPPFVALLIVAGVSFIDDCKGLPVRMRFVVHIMSACTAVGYLFGTKNCMVEVTSGIAFLVIACVWVVGYTNAFNFMDGINGLSAGQALITAAATGLTALSLGVPGDHTVIHMAWVCAAAALGFLPHNFPRAKVFMGDVGSATLGFLLAVITSWVALLTSWWVIFWLGLLHLNFVLDTGITLIRRWRLGASLGQGHREHFYQRMIRAGASHTTVTACEMFVQMCVSMSVWRLTEAPVSYRFGLGLAVVMLWLVLFYVAEGVYRRAAQRVSW